MRLYSYKNPKRAAKVLRKLRVTFPNNYYALYPGGGVYLGRWCIQVTEHQAGNKYFVTTEQTHQRARAAA